MKRELSLILAFVVLILALTACAQNEATPTAPGTGASTEAPTEASTEAPTEAPTEVTYAPDDQNNPNVIKLAIYPYVPDEELFKTLTIEMWEEIAPDVELEFIPWNCFIEPDPFDIDVFMYDALFTTYLAENGFMRPITEADVDNIEGFVSYALESARHNGELYGIPSLLCGNFLIYYKDDTDMAAVENIYQLHDLLNSDTPGTLPKGVDNKLAVKFASDYPYFYLDILIDANGEYDAFDVAPDCTNPDQVAMESLRLLKDMQVDVSGYLAEEDYYGIASAFRYGRGRAFYGYSENLSAMAPLMDYVDIKTISLAENEDKSLFYVDVLSISAEITNQEKVDNCLKLMNLLCSEEFLYRLSIGNGTPQFLLPARTDLYLDVARAYPMYLKLYRLIQEADGYTFRFGKDVHKFLLDGYAQLAIQ